MKQLQDEVCNNPILSPHEVFPEVPRDACDHVYLIVTALDRQMGKSAEKFLQSGVY